MLEAISYYIIVVGITFLEYEINEKQTYSYFFVISVQIPRGKFSSKYDIVKDSTAIIAFCSLREFNTTQLPSCKRIKSHFILFFCKI